MLEPDRVENNNHDQQGEVAEILEKLEPRQQEIISQMISYSGPLPPPEHLEGYVKVHPDAAKQIFGWAEQAQDHRQKMNELIINKSFKQSMVGMILGFIVAMIFVIFSFILIIAGKEVSGFALLIPVITCVAGYLILQNRKSPDNDGSKKEEE